MAKAKKVDVKASAKQRAIAKIREVFESEGIAVEDGVEYGFTASTIVIKDEKTDIQVKLITPKSGVERYDAKKEEE